MKDLRVYARIQVDVDMEQMPNVPIEKIEQVIGQIIVRFSRFNCDTVRIMNDKKNNLICFFRKDGNTKFVLGAIWRNENKEFTFHS